MGFWLAGGLHDLTLWSERREAAHASRVLDFALIFWISSWETRTVDSVDFWWWTTCHTAFVRGSRTVFPNQCCMHRNNRISLSHLWRRQRRNRGTRGAITNSWTRTSESALLTNRFQFNQGIQFWRQVSHPRQKKLFSQAATTAKRFHFLQPSNNPVPTRNALGRQSYQSLTKSPDYAQRSKKAN